MVQRLTADFVAICVIPTFAMFYCVIPTFAKFFIFSSFS